MTTKLQVVNRMLECINESPVDTIINSEYELVQKAVSILEQEDRREQAKGWYFNTLNDYSMESNTDGEIVLPTNTLRAKVSSKYEQYYDNLVVRGTKVYSTTTNTSEVWTSVELDIVLYLDDYTLLPEEYILYLESKACVRYHMLYLGDPDLNIQLQQELQQNHAQWQQHNSEHSNFNVLTNTHNTDILRRSL